MHVNTINTPAFWMHNTHFLCWSWWSDCRWAPYIHAELERRWPSPRSSPLYTVWDNRPVHGAQFNLNKRQQRLWIKTEAWRRSKQITTAFYTCIRHDVRSWQRFSRLWLPSGQTYCSLPNKVSCHLRGCLCCVWNQPKCARVDCVLKYSSASEWNGSARAQSRRDSTNTTDSCVGFEVCELRMRPVWRHDSGDEAFWCKNSNCTEKCCGKI